MDEKEDSPPPPTKSHQNPIDFLTQILSKTTKGAQQNSNFLQNLSLLTNTVKSQFQQHKEEEQQQQPSGGVAMEESASNSPRSWSEWKAANKPPDVSVPQQMPLSNNVPASAQGVTSEQNLLSSLPQGQTIQSQISAPALYSHPHVPTESVQSGPGPSSSALVIPPVTSQPINLPVLQSPTPPTQPPPLSLPPQVQGFPPPVLPQNQPVLPQSQQVLPQNQQVLPQSQPVLPQSQPPPLRGPSWIVGPQNGQPAPGAPSFPQQNFAPPNPQVPQPQAPSGLPPPRFQTDPNTASWYQQGLNPPAPTPPQSSPIWPPPAVPPGRTSPSWNQAGNMPSAPTLGQTSPTWNQPGSLPPASAPAWPPSGNAPPPQSQNNWNAPPPAQGRTSPDWSRPAPQDRTSPPWNPQQPRQGFSGDWNQSEVNSPPSPKTPILPPPPKGILRNRRESSLKEVPITPSASDTNADSDPKPPMQPPSPVEMRNKFLKTGHEDFKVHGSAMDDHREFLEKLKRKTTNNKGGNLISPPVIEDNENETFNISSVFSRKSRSNLTTITTVDMPPVEMPPLEMPEKDSKPSNQGDYTETAKQDDVTSENDSSATKEDPDNAMQIEKVTVGRRRPDKSHDIRFSGGAGQEEESRERDESGYDHNNGDSSYDYRGPPPPHHEDRYRHEPRFRGPRPPFRPPPPGMGPPRPRGFRDPFWRGDRFGPPPPRHPPPFRDHFDPYRRPRPRF